MLSFAVTSADGSVQRLPVAVERLVIAGMTGRDRAKVQEHLDELAELGIAGPSTIPIYYPLSASLVTQADAITVVGHDTSGEVEAMLIGTPKGMLVTVASDHTDRKAEAYSIHLSKQLCAKPIASAAWWYADVADRWDSLTLRGVQDGELYQEGDCTAMLPPVEIIRAGSCRSARCRCMAASAAASGSRFAWVIRRPGGKSAMGIPSTRSTKQPEHSASVSPNAIR
jgi:hypothetical protein